MCVSDMDMKALTTIVAPVMVHLLPMAPNDRVHLTLNGDQLVLQLPEPVEHCAAPFTLQSTQGHWLVSSPSLSDECPLLLKLRPFCVGRYLEISRAGVTGRLQKV